ncbi:DNA/RNA nuclease SfsA [Magnetospira sp. QH-2]|uniref:DNA/RNA nuclease SfsA n=1 Tax=Magnetospira sp. (strain QH-2) TaxID=1288970 RepID=UPI0003E80BAA|nr:DNA/RNA nuclease SfsA [Magnetospira sp. QH-2]CCQ74764.1 sugar fermentation stimulation protein SfsA homolog [Magnetospira sp. QH-2]
MDFPTPLLRGKLIKRYKRFLADVTLDSGEVVTAHCANSGSMLSCKDPDSEVWLSPSDNPKRKLKYTWELIRIGEGLVGINTGRPNKLVAGAIIDGTLTELQGYETLKPEQKYGKNSRIDILLTDPNKPPCYVEVKNVTLMRDGANLAEFPDAVTTRGTKHLQELTDMVAEGHRAVMVYLVQREDCTSFRVAADIDPAYDAALKAATKAGVEALCYTCKLTPSGITVAHPLPIEI